MHHLLVMAEMRDILPATMGGSVWVTLAKLKGQWGVSMQALLFRARRLGRLSDVSYRNAMTTISAGGWRRDEPGPVTAIEQPSLLPKAVELLSHEGIGGPELVSQCRVPADLFRTIISRTPVAFPADSRPRASSPGEHVSKVISLLKRRQPKSLGPDGSRGANGH